MGKIKDIDPNETIRKSVSFAPSEHDLFKHVEDKRKNLKFATYIKNLIREDMNKESLDTRIERKIEEYLKNKKITAVEEETAVDKTEYTSEDLDMLKGFLGKQ